MEEIQRVAGLKDITRCDKLNIAAIGNVVPQLHVHIVARWISDPLWPKPVWGLRRREPGIQRDSRVLSPRSASNLEFPSPIHSLRRGQDRGDGAARLAGRRRAMRGAPLGSGSSIGGRETPPRGGRLIGRLVDDFECGLEGLRHRGDNARQSAPPWRRRFREREKSSYRCLSELAGWLRACRRQIRVDDDRMRSISRSASSVRNFPLLSR